MSQNAKDNNGGKNHPTKNTGANGGKRPGEGTADKKSGSPAGSQNKEGKKTTH